MSEPGALVQTRRSGDVVTFILNRPERHNCLVPELLDALLAKVTAAATDRSVRAVVLAAAGRAFSTGGDVKAFNDAGDQVADYSRKTVGLLNNVMLAMLRMPQPIVAAVHGMVTGGSLGLLLASDIVLVAPEVTITPWYAVVGFSPDGGWTALLPDLIGPRRVGDILLRNATVTAAEAVEWGLASRLVDARDMWDVAHSTAAQVATMQLEAIASAKRLLWGDLDAVAADLEAECEAFVNQIQTEEARTGMLRFLRGTG